MSSCKRFTDFFAGFAAFTAAMYLFCQYMMFDFKEIESLTEKLKYFFSNEPIKDYNFYLTLIGLLLFSCVFSILFHKLPFLTFAISALPMIYIISMLKTGNIYDERPMLYVVLGAIHMGGCLFECIRRDREDRHRRSAIATDLFAAVVVLFCLYVFYTKKILPETEFLELDYLQRRLYYVYEEIDFTVFRNVAICYGVLALFRLIHRDLYYLDAILSLVPFFMLCSMWMTDKIPIFGEVLVMLSASYAVARIAIMLFCKPKCIQDKAPVPKEN